jgi:hypothetical protein
LVAISDKARVAGTAEDMAFYAAVAAGAAPTEEAETPEELETAGTQDGQLKARPQRRHHSFRGAHTVC